MSEEAKVGNMLGCRIEDFGAGQRIKITALAEQDALTVEMIFWLVGTVIYLVKVSIHTFVGGFDNFLGQRLPLRCGHRVMDGRH